MQILLFAIFAIIIIVAPYFVGNIALFKWTEPAPIAWAAGFAMLVMFAILGLAVISMLIHAWEFSITLIEMTQ